MANYRSLHTKLWSDPDNTSLSADALLLFVYLITNTHRNEAGLYRRAPEQMGSESRLGDERAMAALAELVSVNKVFYDTVTRTVWVKNAVRYQSVNENCLTAIANDLNYCPCPELVRAFCEYYKNDTRLIKGRPALAGLCEAILATLSSSHPNGIPNPSTTHADGISNPLITHADGISTLSSSHPNGISTLCPSHPHGIPNPSTTHADGFVEPTLQVVGDRIQGIGYRGGEFEGRGAPSLEEVLTHCQQPGVSIPPTFAKDWYTTLARSGWLDNDGAPVRVWQRYLKICWESRAPDWYAAIAERERRDVADNRPRAPAGGVSPAHSPLTPGQQRTREKLLAKIAGNATGAAMAAATVAATGAVTADGRVP